MNNRYLVFAFFIFFLSISSCKEEPVDDIGASTEISLADASTIAKIDDIVRDITVIVQDQFETQKKIESEIITNPNGNAPQCANVTSQLLSNNNIERSIVFSSLGCDLLNENTLKGKIILNFSKILNGSNRIIRYQLEEFYHNGVLVEGEKYITYDFITSNLLIDPHPISKHEIDLKLTFPDGKIYVRKGSIIKETISGFNATDNYIDMRIKYYGDQTTFFPNKAIFSSKVTTPLLTDFSCKNSFPVSGVINLTRNNGTSILNYGVGLCDNVASITSKGVTKEFVSIK